ncbi:MAG: alanyl-tRNA synthetase [Acidobacteria bacterium]|nr:alanyl-tRNA synthetase [Acidobacteriota bacterium]
MNADAPARSGSKAIAWVKRLGFWGFMFFTIKGLLWLIVPTALAYFSCS